MNHAIKQEMQFDIVQGIWTEVGLCQTIEFKKVEVAKHIRIQVWWLKLHEWTEVD